MVALLGGVIAVDASVAEASSGVEGWVSVDVVDISSDDYLVVEAVAVSVITVLDVDVGSWVVRAI